jgi:hypothetical protein
LKSESRRDEGQSENKSTRHSVAENENVYVAHDLLKAIKIEKNATVMYSGPHHQSRRNCIIMNKE